MSSLEGRRALVTGAAGFVGANLVRQLLHDGADVHALVRPSTNLWRINEIIPRLTLHLADITDAGQLRQTVNDIQPEVIFHLAVHRAASSWEERLATLQANVMGTFNLLEATATVDYHRFVHVGGSLEYGARKRPLTESLRLEPTTFYGVTKAASTLLCRQFAHANRLPIVTLRLFSVYGYWEAATRLIPTAISAALGGREISLTAPGYRRDLVFVEDVVEACLSALGAPRVSGQVINVGSGRQWTNEEVVDMVQAASGQPIKTRVGGYPPRPTDPTHWVADIGKARRLLGWEPRHTLRSGLEKTIAWFRLHRELYGFGEASAAGHGAATSN